MAKTKITALTELTDTNIAIGDLIPIVDISDTSQAASGTTKKVTITSLATAVASAFSGDSPTFVNLTTTGTTTLGDASDATTVNGTLGVTGKTTVAGAAGGIVVTGTGTAVTNITTGLSLNTGYGVSYLNSYNAAGGTVDLHLTASNTLITGNVGLATAGSPAYKLDVNGTLGVTGVATFTDNIAMASGKGIDFSATANSSGTMTSEILSDYEEGTWTPALRDGGTDRSPTYAFNSGSYIKIGGVVLLRWGFKLSNKGTGSGSGEVQIHGLPFTSLSYGAYQEPIVSVHTAELATASYAGLAKLFVNGTAASMSGRIALNADTTWTYNELGNGSWIIGEIFYTV